MENTQRAKAFEGVSTGCWGHVEFEMSTGHQNGDSEQRVGILFEVLKGNNG